MYLQNKKRFDKTRLYALQVSHFQYHWGYKILQRKLNILNISYFALSLVNSCPKHNFSVNYGIGDKWQWRRSFWFWNHYRILFHTEKKVLKIETTLFLIYYICWSHVWIAIKTGRLQKNALEIEKKIQTVKTQKLPKVWTVLKHWDRNLV